MSRDDEIRALDAAGVPQAAIGERFGLCQQRVSQIVRQRVYVRRRAGETVVSICQRVGVSRPTYYAALRDGRVVYDDAGRVLRVVPKEREGRG